MIKIRMARGGRKKKPVYTIVAADSRDPRDGKFLEKLGQYNPLTSDETKTLVNLKTDKISAWVKQGATMSDTVKSLLKRHKVQY